MVRFKPSFGEASGAQRLKPSNDLNVETIQTLKLLPTLVRVPTKHPTINI
jgi:hypothetical protein